MPPTRRVSDRHEKDHAGGRRQLRWNWRQALRRNQSDVDVDVDGGVVGGCLMRAGDLRVDGPLGRRVDVGRRSPETASFDAAADHQPGQVMGDQDVVEPVADPTAFEGAGPRTGGSRANCSRTWLASPPRASSDNYRSPCLRPGGCMAPYARRPRRSSGPRAATSGCPPGRAG
jgi:hypothetical protein